MAVSWLINGGVTKYLLTGMILQVMVVFGRVYVPNNGEGVLVHTNLHMTI